jgi:hypothetical protein
MQAEMHATPFYPNVVSKSPISPHLNRVSSKGSVGSVQECQQHTAGWPLAVNEILTRVAQTYRRYVSNCCDLLRTSSAVTGRTLYDTRLSWAGGSFFQIKCSQLQAPSGSTRLVSGGGLAGGCRRRVG